MSSAVCLRERATMDVDLLNPPPHLDRSSSIKRERENRKLIERKTGEEGEKKGTRGDYAALVGQPDVTHDRNV